MRKFFLLLTTVVFALSANAQRGLIPVKAQREFQKPSKTVKYQKSEKAPGDILWEHDFNGELWSETSDNGEPVPSNVPDGWDLTDETGLGFYWRWDTVGPRGMFTSPTPEVDCHEPRDGLISETAENGFIMLESDHYNTLGDCSGYTEDPMDGAFVYTAGIDFSEANAVHLLFTQYSQFCCPSYSDDVGAWFETSIDGGTTWTKKRVSFVAINEINPNDGVPTKVDITSMVANQSNVIFRFRQQGLDAYWWLIDDVKFLEPLNYDIALTDYWNDYIIDEEGYADANSFTEGYYYYPWFMIQNFVSYSVEYTNIGAMEVTNFVHNIDITKNGSIVASFASEALTSAPIGVTDTTEVDGEFTPDLRGYFSIIHSYTADEADEDTSNDTLIRNFIVGDNTYAAVDYKNRNTSTSPDRWNGYVAGRGFGIQMDIPEPALHGVGSADYYVVEGIEVYVTSQNEAAELALFQNEEAGFVAELYKYNEDSETWSFVIGSSERVLTTSDTSSLVYVPFSPDGSSEYIIEGGTYLANLVFNGTWVDAFDRLQTFTIGENTTQKVAYGATMLVSPGATEVTNPSGGAGACMAFRVSYSDLIPYAEYNATIVVNDVRAPIENARVQVAHYDVRTDADGQVIVTLEDGNYPYIVTYDEVTITGSFVIEGEDKVIDVLGIHSMFAEFSIYPNPSNGAFTVSIEGEANLTVVNLAGQVVDTRTINGTQVVNLDVESGMYFVRVQIGDNVATKQLIVR